MLLKNKEDLGINKELNKLFDRCNRHYGFNLRVDNRNKNHNNITEICKQSKNELLKIEPDEDKIICSVVRLLYEKPSSRKKKLFWMMFGEQLYNNIVENTKSLPQNICMKCGKRTDENLVQRKCSECRKKETVAHNGMKLIRCVDCGKEFEVKSTAARRTKRCTDCKKKQQLSWQRNSMQKKRKI